MSDQEGSEDLFNFVLKSKVSFLVFSGNRISLSICRTSEIVFNPTENQEQCSVL